MEEYIEPTHVTLRRSLANIRQELAVVKAGGHVGQYLFTRENAIRYLEKMEVDYQAMYDEALARYVRSHPGEEIP